MDDCESLRQAIDDAKRGRNQALTANAEAENAGRPKPYDDSTIEGMRAAVDRLARAARKAGCDISDLVGPGVGLD